MSFRRPGVDPEAAELARRRLSLLGAELAPAAGERAVPAVPVGDAPGRHARPRTGVTRRLALRAADGLPPGLHGRFRMSVHHVTVVALTLAVAAALAAWLLVRSAPAEVVRSQRASLVLPAGSHAGAPPGSGTTVASPVHGATAAPVATVSGPAATAPATPATRLVVHVAGKVRRPGVVELPAGARVVDALDAAGGALPGARLDTLNLARPLVDGEQVAVGVPVPASSVPAGPTAAAAPVPASTAAAPTELVNLNTAGQSELEELPGVGPVTAAGIIEWRTEHGGFTSVDELIEVSGIGEVTLAELRDLVTV